MDALLNNEQIALQELRLDIESMMHAVKAQLSKAEEMMEHLDKDLALEILHIEKKINAMELGIDKSCENILALYSPLAMDLRLTLAILSIGTQLERMADIAADIAKYVKDEVFGKKMYKKDLASLQIKTLFETSISMIDDAINSFVDEDTQLAKHVFGKDQIINKITKKTTNDISDLIQKNPEKSQKYLQLFSVIKKIERVGALSKNIAEETIFFVDAKIIKHKSKKKILKR